MNKKLEAILAEDPTFPDFYIRSMPVESIEAVYQFYVVGMTPDQVQRLIGNWQDAADAKKKESEQ